MYINNKFIKQLYYKQIHLYIQKNSIYILKKIFLQYYSWNNYLSKKQYFYQSSNNIIIKIQNKTTRDMQNGIQQMQEGEKDFGVLNSIKSFHKKSLSNPFITQFDLFSVPVNLNINNNEIYQTFFGGLIHIILIAICLLLTIIIVYPYGVQLNSQITQTKLSIDYGNNGQTIFDYTDQPISFKGLLKQGNTFIPTSIKEFVQIRFYQTSLNNEYVELEVSTNCLQGAEFCIRRSPKNENAKIFGSILNNINKNTYLQYQIIWCNKNDPNCPNSLQYAIQVKYSNFLKNKNAKLTEYKIKSNIMIRNQQLSAKVIREIYNSNNKIIGHIANLFHYDIYTYKFDKRTSLIWQDLSKMRTQADYLNRNYVQVNLLSAGQTLLINETFDDISQTLLFFLSVKQTFYLIIFFVFVQQYNKNSGYLQIADNLYYIDDPSTKKKFNFKKGYQVILICWLHNHFISTIINLILIKFGKTINDYLPNKALCAITLIQKAQQLLQQNVFYGTLNNLTMMQSEGPKKVPLQIQKEHQDEDFQQNQIQYFAVYLSDNQAVRKQKYIKKQAFRQFCQSNDYYCSKRKNYVYKVLTNTKLKYLLAHQMQLQFKSFIRNVKVQMSENIYKQLLQQVTGNEQIRIQIQPNEVGLSQNTSQLFIKNK